MQNSTPEFLMSKSPASETSGLIRAAQSTRSISGSQPEGRVRLVADLTTCERDRMYSLMTSHFARVTRGRFEQDLSEKTWVCVVTDLASGQMIGFSTLMRFNAEVGGEPVEALFSGDTIVAREHWGQQVLHRTMGQLMLSLAEQSPTKRTYWLLICSGYKTYRFLPLFSREFYPRYNACTPSGVRRLIDTLAGDKFGSEYYPDAGIVRFDEPTPLRPGVADIDARRLRDSHISFFVRANPGHLMGDELVCIAEVAPTNLTGAGRRFVLGTTQPVSAEI